MRAVALLQRLPHTATAERPRRPRRHRHGKRATATRAAELSLASSASGQDATTDRRSTGSLIVQRARLAGGPIDNASYTCSCGFVFAASVSTTVACPHCGASQAW